GLGGFLDAVVRRNNHIFAVLCRARMVAQGKEPARRHAAHVAAAADLFLPGLQFFQAHAGIALGIGRIGVAPLPFVHFQVAMVVGARIVAAGLQVCAGSLEVIVGRGEGAGGDLLGDFPARDVFLPRYRDAVGAVVRNGVVARAGFVLRHVVGQHQGVLLGVVAKPIVDAFVLHQAADEGEIGLLVLHAVIPVPIGAGQL